MGESLIGARDNMARAIFVVAMAMAAFHLYAASPFWLAPNLAVRAAHLLFAVVLLLLLSPLRRDPMKVKSSTTSFG